MKTWRKIGRKGEKKEKKTIIIQRKRGDERKSQDGLEEVRIRSNKIENIFLYYNKLRTN